MDGVYLLLMVQAGIQVDAADFGTKLKLNTEESPPGELKQEDHGP